MQNIVHKIPTIIDKTKLPLRLIHEAVYKKQRALKAILSFSPWVIFQAPYM